MEWQQNTITLNLTNVNVGLWGRIKVAWKLLRNKTEFKVTVHFASRDGGTYDALYVDSVDGRWVTKGNSE